MVRFAFLRACSVHSFYAPEVSEFAPAFVKAEKGDNMDEDYVYDVFFRHSTTFQDLSEAGSTNIAKL